MSYITGRYFLNGKDIGPTYGMTLINTAGLLQLPKRKAGYSKNWPEISGTEYGPEVPAFEDLSISLGCIVSATTDAQYAASMIAFRDDFVRKAGWQTLLVYDHNTTYAVRYEGAGEPKKLSRRLRNVPKVAVQFDITLTVKAIGY